MKQLLLSITLILFLLSCKYEPKSASTSKSESKHHLNIPEKGIESLMESNAQKIIEGTDGSVIIIVGNVTRKEADITIKRDDKILDEKMVGENEDISFEYEGTSYNIHVGKIKKPLIGEGKVNLTIK
jgi:hypothetical protein